jgi:mono/diheme cytochrome c family protein
MVLPGSGADCGPPWLDPEEKMTPHCPIPRSWLPALLVALGPLGLLSGCSKSWSAASDSPPVVITAEARAEATVVFAERCQNCHGPSGQGDGPAAAGLHPRPRNFGDKMWQSNVTDAHIERIIQFGGPSVGKSPAMAPNPDLISKPQVVAALRERVRSFGLATSPAPQPLQVQPEPQR